ncbi:MAG: hypothetical protein R2792_13945 [Saprospiraceae bacterium]
MKKNLYYFLLWMLIPGTAFSQKFPEHKEEVAINRGPAILVNMSLGYDEPGGDLKDRFGSSGNLGGGIEFLTDNNFIFALDGKFRFGNTVIEDPLEILRTEDGSIIGNDRILASVSTRQRGVISNVTLGKLFPIGTNRSGIRIAVSGGYWVHWIRIQDDNNTVTQLTGDYRKGYDRRAAGFATGQFIGWQHLGANRRANWTLGLDFQQGFTQGIRAWDFSSMQTLDAKRLDLSFGIRATWILPFYLKGSENIYY